MLHNLHEYTCTLLAHRPIHNMYIVYATKVYTFMYNITQMWARAYRDQTYNAAINTTNGVESQNKLLIYSYLPRRKNKTLSQLAKLLYEEFVPETHHKYLYLNYQMSQTYRRYNDIVPDYLRERPRQVIIHRKSSSKKYTEDDILTKDLKMGKFTIQGSGKVHTIDFGVATGKPTCTCPDWLQWQIPCKHFFSIFRLVRRLGMECTSRHIQDKRLPLLRF